MSIREGIDHDSKVRPQGTVKEDQTRLMAIPRLTDWPTDPLLFVRKLFGTRWLVFLLQQFIPAGK